MSEKFPRGLDLPSQSPLFWVGQKDRYLRQLLIRDIESITKRRLIVYFANRFENAQIDSRDPIFVNEILDDIKDEPVDLLIETSGGMTDATDALIALMRNRTKGFRAIIPNATKSNGTLLCLAASSILGRIDIQRIQIMLEAS